MATPQEYISAVSASISGLSPAEGSRIATAIDRVSPSLNLTKISSTQISDVANFIGTAVNQTGSVVIENVSTVVAGIQSIVGINNIVESIQSLSSTVSQIGSILFSGESAVAAPITTYYISEAGDISSITTNSPGSNLEDSWSEYDFSASGAGGDVSLYFEDEGAVEETVYTDIQ